MRRSRLVVLLALSVLALSTQARAMSAPATTTSAGASAASGVPNASRASTGGVTGAPADGGGANSARSTVTTPGGAASKALAPPAAAGATTTPLIPRPLTPTGGFLSRGNRAPARAHPGKQHISALAIVIAALGALLVLACIAWALARRRAFEPHWWLALRHSLAEAGYRVSATWAEFTDWARLGH